MYSAVVGLCCLAALTACAGACLADTGAYLSDLTDLVWPVRQGWGYMGVDSGWQAYGTARVPLRIGAREYAKGLGAVAPGEILVELGGAYAELRAEVGVHGAEPGGVRFRVVVDGKERYQSDVMTSSDPARPVCVALAGGQQMLLVAERPAGEQGYRTVTWADARLVPDPAAHATPRYEEGVDVAPFARIVTCDPHRTAGIRSNRLEEVAPEDVRLESDLARRRDVYQVQPASDGTACVGLVWTSRRRLARLELEFPRASQMPDPAQVRLECWVRTAPWPEESTWQGSWQPWPAACSREGNRLIWPDLRGCPNGAVGTLKVRWLITGSRGPLRVRAARAYTRSTWQTSRIVLCAIGQAPSGQASIEVYNGRLAAPGDGTRCGWDMRAPLALEVRHAVPDFWRGDRTVLRLRTPRGAFGVAIDDVLSRGPVCVRDFGVVVAAARTGGYPSVRPAPAPRGATVLAEVRARPDQTRETAFTRSRSVIQNRDAGPTLLSLPCENHKYLVRRDGGIQVAVPSTSFPPSYSLTVSPRFGDGVVAASERHLEGGWLPAPVTSVECDGVAYRQRVVVAPSGRDGGSPDTPWRGARPLCVAEYTATGPADRPSAVSLGLSLAGAGPNPVAVRAASGGAVVEVGGKVVGRLAVPDGAPWRLEVSGGGLRLTGTLAAGASARACLYLPGWDASEQDTASLPDGDALFGATRRYWEQVLARCAQVEVPDPLVQNTVVASQVHCLMASRSEESGQQVAAWIGATDYPALDSEAHAIIEGMDLFGHSDFARRCLDYFVARYNRAGYLAHGYTLMGTGWHLWVLGRHWELTHDGDWMRAAAPKVAAACRWISAQRRKTMLRGPGGARVPEYGLMPPGVTADWGAYGYGFCPNGYYYAGLASAARALAGVGVADARSIAADAVDLRRELLRAFRLARSQAPVLPLRDGTWVPGYPMQLGLAGRITDFFPDDNMFLTALYDVEIGAHHLAHQGALDPLSRETEWILEQMEDGPFLLAPPLDPSNRPEAAVRGDWYDLGGYASMQPAYCHNMELYAARGDVKPFVRSYLNSMAATLNLENLGFTENTYSYTSTNKTHTTGEFLRRTRLMLLMERGRELWLAPCVTSEWMRDGMAVGVERAATSFGTVSYRIESHVRSGHIEATVEVPTREAPSAVVVRLRHPDGQRIRRVSLQGQGTARADRAHDCVRITGARGTVRIRADYMPGR